MKSSNDVIKVTVGMSKYDVARELGKQFNTVEAKDIELAKRIQYTANEWKKNPDSVPMTELRNLVKDVNKLLAEPETEVPETPIKQEKPKLLKESSLKGKKPLAPKPKPKEEEKKAPLDQPVITTSNPANKRELPTALAFPERFQDLGMVLEAAHDIQSIKDLREALERQETFILAFYWSKRHLKQYQYFYDIFTPKSFVNDMDLAQLIYVSDEDRIAYATSLYTDAMYSLFPKSIPEDEEANNIRYCEGIEYQMYRKMEG